MTVLNYTTTIAAARTISEIQTLLAKHGAARIAIDYADGSPSGLTFSLDTPHGSRLFTLPVDVDAMHRLLIQEYDAGRIKNRRPPMRTREHAERVAWRVIKDWLEAQLAIVQTQMAAVDQVMLPYLRVDENRTLYAAYTERENVLAIERGDR